MSKRILLTLLSLCLLCGACAALAEDAIVSGPVEAAVPDAGELWLEPQAEPAPAQQVSAAKATRSPQVLEVTVSNRLPDDSAWFYNTPLVLQKEAVRFTVRTNTDAKYLYLLSSSGKKLKKWSASKAAKTVKVNGVKQRKWTVKYTFKTAGQKSLYFGASYGSRSAPTGRQAVTPLVLEAPVIRSVSCTPRNPEAGQTVIFTLKTNDAASLLSILDSKGKKVEITYGPFNDQTGDNARELTGSFKLKEGGRQKVTFKVSYARNRGVVKKSVTFNVKDSAIHSAGFFESSVYAGDPVQAHAKTGVDAAVLALFNENNELVTEWEAGEHSAVVAGERVWTVETTLRRIGKHKYSFRTRATPLTAYAGSDAAQFNSRKDASITVKAKKVPDVDYARCALTRMNRYGHFEPLYYACDHRLRNDRYLASVDQLLVTFGAPDNARYVHIYNEKGEQVLREAIDETTASYQELETPKQWNVPVYLMKGADEWGSTFTVKVSTDGTTVGEGKRFTIVGADPKPITAGGVLDLFISGRMNYEESFSAVSFTAPESRTYTFWTDNAEGNVHSLLYRAGSNEIIRDDEFVRVPSENRQYVELAARAGETYVLRLDLLKCNGMNKALHCD